MPPKKNPNPKKEPPKKAVANKKSQEIIDIVVGSTASVARRRSHSLPLNRKKAPIVAAKSGPKFASITSHNYATRSSGEDKLTDYQETPKKVSASAKKDLDSPEDEEHTPPSSDIPQQASSGKKRGKYKKHTKFLIRSEHVPAKIRRFYRSRKKASSDKLTNRGRYKCGKCGLTDDSNHDCMYTLVRESHLIEYQGEIARESLDMWRSQEHQRQNVRTREEINDPNTTFSFKKPDPPQEKPSGSDDE
jgi:DNA mismatch repair ATPase MutL